MALIINSRAKTKHEIVLLTVLLHGLPEILGEKGILNRIEPLERLYKVHFLSTDSAVLWGRALQVFEQW